MKNTDKHESAYMDNYKGFKIEKIQFKLKYQDEESLLPAFYGANKDDCFVTANSIEDIKNKIGKYLD